MIKKMTGLGAALAILAGFGAQAQDVPRAPGSGTPITPGMSIPAPYTSIPGPALTDPKPATGASAAAPASNFITATLIDGSKVEFDPDGSVQVVAKDGTKTPAPDGMLTLKDGVPFVVKDGKRFSEY